MICPTCGNRNFPGADCCEWCEFALTAVDQPTPQDRVDRSLMTEPVSVLQPRLPVCLSADAPLGIAVNEMLKRSVGAILVTDCHGCLVGILTERDFLTKVAGQPGYAKLPLGQFMTRNPETVGVSDTLAYALGKMAGGGYRHVPVVEGDLPIGVISVRDILKHIVQLCQDV